jgi:hypothetical protein
MKPPSIRIPPSNLKTSEKRAEASKLVQEEDSDSGEQPAKGRNYRESIYISGYRNAGMRTTVQQPASSCLYYLRARIGHWGSLLAAKFLPIIESNNGKSDRPVIERQMASPENTKGKYVAPRAAAITITIQLWL